MPIVPSSYRSPWWLPGGHLQTLAPALFGSRRNPGYRRQRVELPDGDFLDLDWLRNGSSHLAILVHGLEGSSFSPYMTGMARALRSADHAWDVLSINLRGCGGEPNRTLRFYHSGETGDLRTILKTNTAPYSSVALIGFSLGGNVVLKYLGEAPDEVDSKIAAAIAFSVPCHLATSAEVLARPINRIYMFRFLRTLIAKIRHQAHRLPQAIDLTGIGSIRTFKAFDGRFTGPLHGFRDAEDYWAKCSSRQFLPAIRIPTLLVNARNDPFLSPECFPEDEARSHRRLFLECPASGGHLGFPGWKTGSPSWIEERVLSFLDTVVENPKTDLDPRRIE
ncbi:MAG: alpha/beta hydrolase [Verrucomicrobia bacterium]|nr:MAG: alpha/beta hydrolase [Verrucomicrobiota bacterium]